MIVVAIGANLPGPGGNPLETCERALQDLDGAGLTILARSPWYRSRAVPASRQPDFINGVMLLQSDLAAADLLARLHAVEARHGRRRSRRNAARTLDLDLIDWRGRVRPGRPHLPHPRAHLRAFVLAPLCDLAPGWRHPVLGRQARCLLARLPRSQRRAPALTRIGCQ